MRSPSAQDGSSLILAFDVGGTRIKAALMDGSTSAQMAWRITLPSLVPTILVLLLLSIGRIF